MSSSASKGFGAVFGGVFGFFFAIVALMALGIGGCLVMLGGTAAVVAPAAQQAAESARIAREKRDAERNAELQAIAAEEPVQEAAPVVVDEPAIPVVADPVVPVPAPASVTPAITVTEDVVVADTPSGPSAEDERKATAKLKLGESMRSKGNDVSAEKYFRDVVEQFPGTEAAAKAETYLK